jgi:RNA polymerase sigma-70 factor (ECF subfamily)
VATSAQQPDPVRRPAGEVLVLPPRENGRLSARAERALVRAAQRGDRAAVERLFAAHWAAAHRAAWYVVRDAAAAEDVAQEAFLAAVRALGRFDRRRPFGPWLRAIVARRAIDALRASRARREVSDDALHALPAPPQRSDGPSSELAAALLALPADQRVPIVLRHVLGMTPSEVAASLDLPVGTVNSRLRRGLDALGREDLR